MLYRKAFRSLENALLKIFEKKKSFLSTFNLNSLIINTDFEPRNGTTVQRNFQRSSREMWISPHSIVTVWLISSSWVSRTRTRIRDISQTSTWETIFVVFRSISNPPRTPRTKRRRRRREYDLRLPDCHVRGVLECYAHRITHTHSNIGTKMKVPQILTPPQTPVMMQEDSSSQQERKDIITLSSKVQCVFVRDVRAIVSVSQLSVFTFSTPKTDATIESQRSNEHSVMTNTFEHRYF